MRRGIRRRLVLVAAVGVAHRAGAQARPKASRATVKYQDTPRGGMSCAACTFFRSPGSCQVVEGAVSPNGWCQLFDMPD